MRDVYASVREHLQVAASRRKRYYDIRVKERNFRPGIVGMVLLSESQSSEITKVAVYVHRAVPHHQGFTTRWRRSAED